MKVEELSGNIRTFQMKLNNASNKSKDKKSVALKTSQPSPSKEESSNENESDNEDVALLAKRFLRQFKNKTSNFNKKEKPFDKSKNKASSSSKYQSRNVKCYNCQKFGHISSECPIERKIKKKTIVATWDDSSEAESDSDESHQDETENYTILMARTLCGSPFDMVENSGKTNVQKSESGSESKYDGPDDEKDDEDPQETYDRLYEESCKFIEAISKQESKNKVLNEKIETLTDKKNTLANELKEINSKFQIANENLNKFKSDEKEAETLKEVITQLKK